jgi:putative Holliday junction resolvase
MGRILAIDFGTKRIGLAVTDPLKIIASSLATIETKTAISWIKDYCSKEEVETFVVGKPLQMDGSDSESAAATEKFISLLAQSFPNIAIARIDERLTSKIASRAMVEMGLKKKDRQKKGNIDQISAVLILQSFMDMRQQ